MHNQLSKNYNTVTEALKDLNTRGYTIDFTLVKNQVHLMNNVAEGSLSPEEFQIDETHRFEGNTDPEDEMIVFAISSKKYKVKGFVTNSYGMYADTRAAKVVELLKHI